MDKKKLLLALPPEARLKLDALNRRSIAAHAEMRGINDEVHAAHDSLHHFQVVRGRGQRRPPDEDAVEKARNDAAEAALKEEIRRLQSISDEASQRTAPLRELVGRCFAWVEAVTDVGGKIVEVKPSILGRETLAAIRQKLAALDYQIEQVERAPAPAGELLALALAGIDRMASAGAPIVATGERVNDPIGLFDKLRLASLVPV
ncbi:hypothetical protein AFEL58S_01629 [Afipia felis]